MASAIAIVVAGCGRAPERSTSFAETAPAPEMLRLDNGVVVDADSGKISIPSGHSVSWFVSIPPQSSLQVGPVTAHRLDGGKLSVSVYLDGEQPKTIAEFEAAHDAVSLPLDAYRDRIAEIVVGASQAGGDRPALWEVGKLAMRAPGGPAAVETPSPSSASAKPNIIVYLADAMRRDHAGVYGGRKELTPNIDAFAQHATVFDKAVAQAPWTRPSVASIFTGLEPQGHGVQDRKDSLSPDALTLAELLSAGGYFTAEVITNGNVGPQFGMSQGFRIVSKARNHELGSKQTTDRALGVLKGDAIRQPFFLYVHNLDPHHPYELADKSFESLVGKIIDPELGTEEYLKKVRQRKVHPTARQKEGVHQLYESEVPYMDREFGRLMDYLKQVGLYDQSLVIFLADHGEEFWDHGDWGHGQTFYGEVIDIPLIIKAPGQREGRRVESLAQHVDLLPTLLDYAHQSDPVPGHGESLRARVEGRGEHEPARHRFAMSHLNLDGRKGVSITDGAWRLIMMGKFRDRIELYDRRTDPGEKHDLATARPIVREYFRRHLERMEGSIGEALQAEQGTVDPELREQLTALGYLQ